MIPKTFSHHRKTLGQNIDTKSSSVVAYNIRRQRQRHSNSLREIIHQKPEALVHLMAMQSTASLILCIPPELLLMVASYLAPDAHLALRLSHPHFYASLPALRKPPELSRCAKIAIRSYLELAHPDSASGELPHIRCIMCKQIYPPDMFTSRNSPAVLASPPAASPGAVGEHGPATSCIATGDAGNRTGQQNTEIIHLPPRFCAWHVGRLTRIVRLPPRDASTSREPAGWSSTLDQMCMHCGAVQGWNNKDKQSTGCECGCQSCGMRKVRTYTRYLDHEKDKGWEVKGWRFWRDEKEALWVREVGRAEGMFIHPLHGKPLECPHHCKAE